MRDENVGSVVVVDEIDGRRVPRGIVTDRDIVLRAICETPSPCMGETAVADIMTPDLITEREHEDLADVLARMQAFGVRRIPIVDDDGGLQGIISFDDVLEWSSERMRDLAELLSRERENEGARDRSRRRWSKRLPQCLGSGRLERHGACESRSMIQSVVQYLHGARVPFRLAS